MTDELGPTESASSLYLELSSALKPELCADEETYNDFSERLKQGGLTRSENPATHFGVFVLPVDRETGEVLLVFHKKANIWIPAGGHTELGETTRKTLIRESEEELGLVLQEEDNRIEPPFFFSIVEINNPKRECKKHYDTWYLVNVQKEDLTHQNDEFTQVRWVRPVDALSDGSITDPSTIKALEKLVSRQS